MAVSPALVGLPIDPGYVHITQFIKDVYLDVAIPDRRGDARKVRLSRAHRNRQAEDLRIELRPPLWNQESRSMKNTRAQMMADDENVRLGTRYDALRMIALDGWDKRGDHLRRYLADGTEDELQMGAISGLVDMQSEEVANVLIERLPHLSARNQKLAIAGLLRTEQRALALLEAAETGRVSTELLADSWNALWR